MVKDLETMMTALNASFSKPETFYFTIHALDTRYTDYLMNLITNPKIYSYPTLKNNYDIKQPPKIYVNYSKPNQYVRMMKK